MKKSLFPIILTFCVLISASPANAGLLGSFDFTVIGGGFGVFSEIDVDLGYSSTGDALDTAKIFDSLSLDNGDVGAMFEIASNADDPNFDLFTSYLTDGVDQLLAYQMFVTSGQAYESDRFATAPDFQGFNIEKYKLTVNSFVLDVPGSDPNRNGEWSDINANLTFSVFGSDPSANAVPEPATMVLFGTGLAGMYFRKKYI